VIARLALAPAAANAAVTALPRAAVAPTSGKHDVCLRFAQPALEPLWVLESIRFDETAP
jgi:hexosaminidase